MTLRCSQASKFSVITRIALVLFAGSTNSCVTGVGEEDVVVETSIAANTVAPNFIGYMLHYEHFLGTNTVRPIDLNQPVFKGMVKQLGEIPLHLSGLSSDQVEYDLAVTPVAQPTDSNNTMLLTQDAWRRFDDFIAETGAQPHITLSNGPWAHDDNNQLQTDRYGSLLEHIVDRKTPIAGWRLGYAPNTAQLRNGYFHSGAVLAANYRKLRSVLRSFFDDPWLMGPSAIFDRRNSSIKANERSAVLFQEFVRESGSAVDGINWQYTAYDSPACDALNGAPVATVAPSISDINAIGQSAKPLQTIVEALANEVSLIADYRPADCGGDATATGSFGASMLWLTTLAELAINGHQQVIYDNVIGDNNSLITTDSYQPRPAYFTTRLWQLLMGPTVLQAAAQAGSDDLRVYAHCSANEAGVTVLALNFADQQQGTNILVPQATGAQVWLVEAASLAANSLSVNQIVATVDDTGFWGLPSANIVAGNTDKIFLALPANSFAFLKIPGANGVCQ